MVIQIKDTEWKNSEDEILKAGVMKYGVNRWSKVSSLLTRKTPIQCKLRWLEYLSPLIKHEEWTREEKVKLVEAVGIFGSLWSTISRIVSRTPTQCYEMYTQILNSNIDVYKSTETRACTSDPPVLDANEMEMVDMARARIMNTKGRKALRKDRIRERMGHRKPSFAKKMGELSVEAPLHGDVGECLDAEIMTRGSVCAERGTRDIGSGSEHEGKRCLPEEGDKIA
jgi:pre-mRNA-splicing factor CDC5/CEF1